MAYVTTEKMLRAAQRGGWAVGAFNAENLEMVQAIVAAAVEARSPVIIQTTTSTLKYASPAAFAGMVRAESEAADADVALHLDHGADFAICARCLRAGYSSIKIDGSKEPLEDNIAITQRVVEMCRAAGAPVEAELGEVGGKEDATVSSGANLTNPADAARFVLETGVDSLAVGIGTAHGIYKSTPHLDIGRLAEIRKVVDIPLVLHGASGLTEKDVRDCIERGICKVNFATELRQAFTAAVRDFLTADADAFDPKKYGVKAREAVKAQVLARMAVCGSVGKLGEARA